MGGVSAEANNEAVAEMTGLDVKDIIASQVLLGSESKLDQA